MSKPTVYVIIYSMYGHIKTMADSVVKGIEASGVAEAKLWQVPETLPKEVTDKMYAQKFEIPVITPRDLPNADGFIFGFPTRFGIPCAQMKAFWDATGGIWTKGLLAGKYAGCFTSTSTQHGGQETTIMTFLPHLAHHGILYVPLGFSTPLLSKLDEVIGGSPWGAGTITSGDGKKQPSPTELQIAEHQGKTFAEILAKVRK